MDDGQEKILFILRSSIDCDNQESIPDNSPCSLGLLCIFMFNVFPLTLRNAGQWIKAKQIKKRWNYAVVQLIPDSVGDRVEGDFKEKRSAKNRTPKD